MIPFSSNIANKPQCVKEKERGGKGRSMSVTEAGGRAGRREHIVGPKWALFYMIWLKLGHEQLCNFLSHGDLMKEFIYIRKEIRKINPLVHLKRGKVGNMRKNGRMRK